jgi:hypothetical protein
LVIALEVRFPQVKVLAGFTAERTEVFLSAR